MGRKVNSFISTLRYAFSHHYTLKDVWAMLLGDKVPSPYQRQVLIAHFKSYGLEVSPRDFIRGTAASNNPIFINLRLLRRSGDRYVLEKFLNDISAQPAKGNNHYAER